MGRARRPHLCGLCTSSTIQNMLVNLSNMCLKALEYSFIDFGRYSDSPVEILTFRFSTPSAELFQIMRK